MPAREGAGLGASQRRFPLLSPILLASEKIPRLAGITQIPRGISAIQRRPRHLSWRSAPAFSKS
jgi:hypothetical protein